MKRMKLLRDEKGRFYSEEIFSVHQLRDLYQRQKMSANIIAKKFGVSNGYVLRRLRRFGIKLRSISEYQNVFELHKQNYGPSMIASLLGLNEPLVSRWLNLSRIPFEVRKTIGEETEVREWLKTL